MAMEILKDDWSDYDNQKKKREDRLFFTPTEEWEIAYLVAKIKKFYPLKSEYAIREAIKNSAKQINWPYARDRFVTNVMESL